MSYWSSSAAPRAAFSSKRIATAPRPATPSGPQMDPRSLDYRRTGLDAEVAALVSVVVHGLPLVSHPRSYVWLSDPSARRGPLTRGRHCRGFFCVRRPSVWGCRTDRVVVADRGLEQRLGIRWRGRHPELKTVHVHDPALERLRVLRGLATRSAAVRPQHKWDAGLTAEQVADMGRHSNGPAREFATTSLTGR